MTNDLRSQFSIFRWSRDCDRDLYAHSQTSGVAHKLPYFVTTCIFIGLSCQMPRYVSWDTFETRHPPEQSSHYNMNYSRIMVDKAQGTSNFETINSIVDVSRVE